MEIRARKWLAGVAALLMGAGCYEGTGVEEDIGQPPAGAVGPEASPPTPEEIEAAELQEDEILPSPQVLRSAEPRPEVVEPSVGGMPREGAVLPPEAADRSLAGQVVAAGPEELRVMVPGEPELRLVVTPETVVLLDGQMGTAVDIPEGAAVRVMYQEQEGEPVAYFVEVRTRGRRPETPPGRDRGGEEPRAPRPPEFQTPLDED